MIRIVFENGGIAEFDNVEKIYIEKDDYVFKTQSVDHLVPIGFGECNKKEDPDETMA